MTGDQEQEEAGPQAATSLSAAADRPARRPGTVTTVAWILYISGGMGLLAVVALIALAATTGGENRQAVIMWSGLVGAAAVLVIALGRGVRRGRRWAQSVAVTLTVVALAFDVLVLLRVLDVPGPLGPVVIRMVIDAVIVGLLLSPSARRYFRTAR